MDLTVPQFAAIVLAYLLVVNLIAFALMGIDKKKAERGAWRIKEATLFFWAIIGGSIGANLGMKVFRHKTKHTQFVIGMPAILIFQVLIAVVILVQVVRH